MQVQSAPERDKQWVDVTCHLPPWATRCCCSAVTACGDSQRCWSVSGIKKLQNKLYFLTQHFGDAKFITRKDDVSYGTTPTSSGQVIHLAAVRKMQSREDELLPLWLKKSEKKKLGVSPPPRSELSHMWNFSTVCICASTGLLDNFSHVPRHTQLSAIWLNTNSPPSNTPLTLTPPCQPVHCIFTTNVLLAEEVLRSFTSTEAVIPECKNTLFLYFTLKYIKYQSKSIHYAEWPLSEYCITVTIV